MDVKTMDESILVKHYSKLILSILDSEYVPSELLNSASIDVIKAVFPTKNFKVFLGTAKVLDDGSFEVTIRKDRRHINNLNWFVVNYLLPCNGDYPIIRRIRKMVE